MDQPSWMAQAWAHFGEREIAGPEHSPEIVGYFRDARHPEIGDDETPWCAAFVGACLEQAGVASSGSLMARSYLQWGQSADSDREKSGAIAVLSRGGDAAAGHVGFLLGETADGVVLLGGNQADSVSVAVFPKTRLLGVRWPAAEASSSVDQGQEVSRSEVPNSVDGGDSMFERVLAHVLEMEGGYSDDPHDPGGPTNQGIILSVFARYLKRPVTAGTRGLLIDELKQISPDVVRNIYRSRYWEPCRASEMPPGVAIMHFDASVNHGLSGSAQLLQQAAGVEVDGEIGPITLAAVRGADPVTLIERYGEYRRQRYRGLPHFWRFGKGWLRRVDETAGVAHRATNMTANERNGPNATKGTDMIGTGTTLQGGKFWGSSMTIWGALITGLSTVVPVLGPAIGLDLTPDIVRQAGEQIISVVQAAGGLIGTVMTIYGRARATSVLTG